MREQLVAIREIINDMSDTFDSHDFIKKFSKRFELDYVDLLATANSIEPFQTVNKQIGRFLSDNQTMLRIECMGKINSENVFGNKTKCEKWKKV
ncbi:MAG: hypothetical protein WCY79_03015 [Bacteroidales bacterium]